MPGGGPVAAAAVVAAWFLIAGALGALAWWRIAPQPGYTRTKDNAVMSALEFGQQVGIDGSYVVIGLVLALVSGAALAWWRSARPLWLVLTVLLASVAAAWVMIGLGRVLGPADPRTVIAHLQVGQKAPLRLAPVAYTVWIAWPLGAMLGAGSVLMWTGPRSAGHRVGETDGDISPSGADATVARPR